VPLHMCDKQACDFDDFAEVYTAAVTIHSRHFSQEALSALKTTLIVARLKRRIGELTDTFSEPDEDGFMEFTRVRAANMRARLQTRFEYQRTMLQRPDAATAIPDDRVLAVFREAA